MDPWPRWWPLLLFGSVTPPRPQYQPPDVAGWDQSWGLDGTDFTFMILCISSTLFHLLLKVLAPLGNLENLGCVWAAAIPQIFLHTGIGTWSLEDSRYISGYAAAVKWTRVKPEYFRVIAACLRISHRLGKWILPCTASLEATSHGKEPSPHLRDELLWIVSDMWFTCGQSKFGTGINRNLVDVYDHEIQACIWDAHIW